MFFPEHFYTNLSRFFGSINKWGTKRGMRVKPLHYSFSWLNFQDNCDNRCSYSEAWITKSRHKSRHKYHKTTNLCQMDTNAHIRHKHWSWLFCVVVYHSIHYPLKVLNIGFFEHKEMSFLSEVHLHCVLPYKNFNFYL